MGIRDLATKLGLRTDEGEQASETSPGTQQPPAVAAASISSVPLSGFIAGADTQQVELIKSSVLGSSPVLTTFLSNCKLMETAIPNDHAARMRAALVMTGANITKETLLAELDRTVTAALQHAKNGAEEDRKHARQDAVGQLEKEFKTISDDIPKLEASIAEAQRKLQERRDRATAINANIEAEDNKLKQQDAVVKASFTEVERFLTSLKQTFGQL